MSAPRRMVDADAPALAPAPLIPRATLDSVPIPLADRFWRQVAKSADCWLWVGGAHPDGYGQFNLLGITVPAHRFSYELTVGQIPSKYFVCHHCDTPACVRPDHLFVGTAADNNADMHRKGRYGHPPGRTPSIPTRTIIAIRQEYAARPQRGALEKLAREHGISASQVRRIVHRQAYRHVP